MDITITGRRLNVGEDLRNFVEEQLENATKIFKIDPMIIEVVLRREARPNHTNPAIAEITLRTKGHIIRTEAADEDVKLAVEAATARLERQMRKFKTRVVDRKQNAPKLAEVLASDQLTEADTADSDDSDQLVRVKEIDLDILSTEEALLEMDLLGHDFFVYIAAEDGATSVLYRRHDGGYGLIRQRLESAEV